MLSVRNLYSGYGKLRILFGVSVDVPDKKMTVVVGPNGAGKTTLLNSIMGIADVFSGEILLEGSDIAGIPTHKVARMGISYVPQMGNVFANLTVEENLTMAGYTLEEGERREKVKEVTGMFPVLEEFMHRKAGTLSGGERRMLAIAMGLMRKPKLMLLDEVSTDLAPIIAKRVLSKVVELRDELGLTILLVEQMARRALEIGDSAYLLVSGEIRFSGKAEELLRHPELARMYLGIRE